MQRRINTLNVLEWDVIHGDKKKGIYFSRTGKKFLIEKPMDFYNWRHSSCVLAKLDNLPLEEACKKYGHSAEYFTKTYGRMTTDDSIARLSKVYGLTKAKDEVKQNIKCKRCQFINKPEQEICEQCGAALSVEAAFKVEQDRKTEIEKMKADILKTIRQDVEKKIKVEG